MFRQIIPQADACCYSLIDAKSTVRGSELTANHNEYYALFCFSSMTSSKSFSPCGFQRFGLFYEPVLFSYITAVSYVDIASQSPIMTSSIAISVVSSGPLDASKTI